PRPHLSRLFPYTTLFRSKERIFLENELALITNTRAVINNKTFSMSNIASVQLEYRKPFGCSGWIAIVIGSSFIPMLFISEVIKTPAPWLLSILFALGIWMVRQKKFVLTLTKAGAVMNAYYNYNVV